MPATPEPTQPTAPSFAEDLTPVAAPKGAPTPQDYAREWGTYRAVHDLMVDGSLAVPAGGSVPASHPMIREWVSNGAVELTGDYPAPGGLG